MQKKIFYILLSFLGLILIGLFISVSFLRQATVSTLIAEQLDLKTKERVAYFKRFVRHKTRIVNSLHDNTDLRDFVEFDVKRNVVQNLFVTISKMYGDIFQIRYIDENGHEIIRVDNHKILHIIEKENLQDKSNRYYFKDALSTNKDGIYYSNIDLNIEHGKHNITMIPTLRIARPFVINGLKRGIVIINIDLSEYLKNMQNAELHEVNLIYGDGSIIISKGQKYNWSRDLKKDVKIFDIYPFIPKDFAKYNILKTKQFSISKIGIGSKDAIYMLLIPKVFQKYSKIVNNTKYIMFLLITITILAIPVSYFISKYIEKLYIEKNDMKKLVYIDELTKTYSRKAFNEKLDEKIGLYNRYKTKFSIIMYDIDNFKNINDKYGHAIGDKFLIYISEKVNSVIRDTDVLFRIGGEEFIVILTNMGLDNASFVAEKIRLEIENMRIIKDKKITISLGVCEFNDKNDSVSIYQKVDQLLYASKNAGKNRVTKG